MSWSKKYKRSIDCNNPKGFSQKAHCQGRKKKNENTMKLSELKEIVRELSREKFYESLNELSIQPGSKEYVNIKDSDEKLLDIARQYSEFPHTRLKTNQKQLIIAFKDISKLLGLPIQHPMDVIQYSGGKPKAAPFPKIKVNKAPLLQMHKSGKLEMKEYGALVSKLYRKLEGIVVSYLAFLYVQGGHVNVKGSNVAKRAAMKDMGNGFTASL